MKKLLSIVLSISLLLSMGTVSFAEENSVEVIDAVTAQKIATNFAIARAQSEDTEESFPLPFKVVFDETMYDFEGNVSAYKFDVVNIDEEYSGYIITGAQSEYAPIIEYSTSGTESFIDNAKAEISNNENALKVYYNGGFDYFVESTEADSAGVYDASNSSMVSRSVAMLANNAELTNITAGATASLVSEQQLETEWENTLAQVMSSNPPTSGYISDPFDHETGYSGYTMDYINNATGQPYVSTTTTPYSNYSTGCGPIAATNLMIYNSRANGKTSLMYNGSWANTFQRFRTLTNHVDGYYVIVRNLTAAIENFCIAQGYSNSDAYFQDNPSVNYMISSVQSDDPQIILVNNHYTYDDHYMLTLGYETYRYSNGSSTTYFRVADGVSGNSVNRYIYYDAPIFVSVINVDVS
ncbi:MAG: hypothetical protein IKA17_07815 [Clostridia bacterium]|nr:hypothetical protein [Clostridia bacterium]